MLVNKSGRDLHTTTFVRQRQLKRIEVFAAAVTYEFDILGVYDTAWFPGGGVACSSKSFDESRLLIGNYNHRNRESEIQLLDMAKVVQDYDAPREWCKEIAKVCLHLC